MEMSGPCIKHSAPDLSIVMNSKWRLRGGYDSANLGGRLGDILSHGRGNGCHGGDGKAFGACFCMRMIPTSG